MSDILISKEIRHRCKAALAGAGIAVDLGAGPVAVSILQSLPAGWVLPDEKLPALYVFSSGETLTPLNLAEVERRLFLDVVLMARGGADPMDQLDDMQLGVEAAMIDAGGFGIARENNLLSAEVAQNQGALVIGVRVLKFEIVFGATPGDPSL